MSFLLILPTLGCIHQWKSNSLKDRFQTSRKALPEYQWDSPSPAVQAKLFYSFHDLGNFPYPNYIRTKFPKCLFNLFSFVLSLLNTEPDGKSSSFLKLWFLPSHKKIVIKNSNFGAGEIVQWLRTLADLPGDLGWIPSTQSCSLQSLVSGDPAPSPGLQVPGT